MTGHAERAHALLSASASHRWLHCPPSARLEERLPEPEAADYALEGTLAHEIAEIVARDRLEGTGRDALEPLKSNRLYSIAMVRHAEEWAELIAEKSSELEAPVIALESHVNYSSYAPEGYGTTDCVIISPTVLHVMDYKYGTGVRVDADHNSQMMLYALGAQELYNVLFSPETVRMTIFQPRLDHLSTAELPMKALKMWGDSIKDTAQDAYNGEGSYRAGHWCKFCKAKAVCRARAEHYMSLEELAASDPKLLSLDEIGYILLKAEGFDDWLNAVKAQAQESALAGHSIAGWKLVEGRSNRMVTDMDAVHEKLIASGINREMLFERKPLTLSGLESLCGKKKFAELCGEYIEKPAGKPTLVPASDERPEYNSAAVDFR